MIEIVTLRPVATSMPERQKLTGGAWRA